MRTIRTVVGIALVLLTAGTWASAATLNVPSTYSTIQAGIDAATDGDVVLVAPGTYSGPGNRDISLRGKEIRLEGEAGPEVTIVDCGGSAEEPHRGFVCDSGETQATTIAGFQIINAYNHVGRGSAILVQHPYAATFEDCIVRGCSAGWSVVDASYAEMRHVLVEDCTGSGIVTLGGGEVFDVRVRNNDGGGIVLENSCTVSNSVVRGNSGGGVYCDAASELHNVAIEGNGGIGVTVQVGSPRFVECTIAGNGDAAIWSFQAGPEFERCAIHSNQFVGESYYGQVTLSCCLLDAETYFGSNGWIIEDPLLLEDPLFCDGMDWQDAPTMSGNYFVMEGSPCLPENNPCGLQIGAHGEGCDVSSVLSAGVVVQSEITFISQMPARDEIRFRLNSALTGGSVRAILLDPAGRRVASREFSGFEAGGELEWRPEADLPTGTYLLRVVSDSGESASGKFVWLN